MKEGIYVKRTYEIYIYILYILSCVSHYFPEQENGRFTYNWFLESNGKYF